MTTKRFWKFNITGADDHTLYLGVKDSQTGKYYHTKDGENARELQLLLNALYEENQHLKGALKELKEIGDYQAMRIQELDDENEQLKQFIKLLESCGGRIYLRSGLAYKTDKILKGDDEND